MSSTPSKRRLGALILPLALAGCGQAAVQPTTVIPSAPVASTPPASTVPSASAYRDGRYDAVGNYVSPGGPEEVGVSVTLENGIVTAVEVTPRASRPISVKMQDAVKANVGPMVVGMPIADLTVGKVSGSSLTPQGFNDALEKIRVQAAA